MNPTSADAKRIFLESVESYLPHEWEPFVASQCAGNPTLLQRVQELLAAHLQLLENTLGDDTVDDRPPGPSAGDQVGPYTLLQQIGEGGFGMVYRAQQLQPLCRVVALKLLKPGVDTRQVIARFEAERHTLALMEHPNIARILDAGATKSGNPYFVMELVDGISIKDFCQRERSTIGERLRLFVEACLAINHAHLKGIIHRDIKPSNVLVMSDNGQPVVKVIDFGIAKALGSHDSQVTLMTADRQLVGTPMYMSPEQATFNPVDVDIRSDIYSLGALLYEMLTGVNIFDFKSTNPLVHNELLQLIQHQDPLKPSGRIRKLELHKRLEIAVERQLKPSELERQIRPELDWIVMKALNKQPVFRYQSASELAADVQRFLNHQPVEACPSSSFYIAKKYLSRHKLASATSALIAVILFAATGISLWLANESRAAKLLSDQHLEVAYRAQREVMERGQELRKMLYALEMTAAWQFWRAGDSRAAQQALQHHLPSDGNEDHRGFAWHYLNYTLSHELLSMAGNESPILEVAVSPDNRWIASCDRGGHILIYNLDTGAKLQDLQYASKEVTSVVFSPDSRWLATAGQDSRIHVWHTTDWREKRSFGEHDGTITSIAWSPDGQAIASAGRDQSVRIWDPHTGECIQTFSNLNDVVRCVTWSPDGKRLAAADGPTVRLWETQTWQLQKQWHDQPDSLHSLAFSPDGRQLAAAGYGIDIWVYDVERLVASSRLETRSDHIRWLAFSPDNLHLVAGSFLRGPLIWRRKGLGFERVFSTNHVDDELPCLAFADQGRKLVTASAVTQLVSVLDFTRLFGVRRQLLDNRLVARNLEHDRLASVAADGSICFSSFQSGQLLGTLTGTTQPLGAAAFSDAADKLATASQHEISIWDAQQAMLLRRMPDAPWPVQRLLFSPLGNLLACGDERGNVQLLEVSTGRVRSDFKSTGYAGANFAFSPDESLLAHSLENPFKIQVWSTLDAKLQVELTTRAINGLQFSPDGKLLIGSSERGIEIWSIADRALVASLAHSTRVTGIDVSADGRTLASMDIDQRVRLWNLATGSEMFTILQHDQPLDFVQFASPSMLVVGAHFADSPHPGFLIFDAAEQEHVESTTVARQQY